MQVQAPHQCWQMDFKGEEVGGCGIVIAPLMVCDETSGAPLAGIVHEVKAKGNRSGGVRRPSRQGAQEARRLFRKGHAGATAESETPQHVV